MSMIVAKVSLAHDRVIVASDEDTIELRWIDCDRPDIVTHDFAARLFLPIAMAKGCDLVIDGTGSAIAKSNAERLSDIWALWLPDLYSNIRVDFAEEHAGSLSPQQGSMKSLMFFSGGIDSTFALLRRGIAGLKQDVITLQGMDYRINDDARFRALQEKTTPIAHKYGKARYFVEADAYRAYAKYGISGQLSHIFLLTGVGFLYHRQYRECVISADLTRAQQFVSLPVGSTCATNPFFDSGNFRLKIEGEDVTRAEKLPLICASEEALKSASFCVDYESRPENCGVCRKCVRTKIMFMAATGKIPDNVFLEPIFTKEMQRQCLADTPEVHRSFMYDAYVVALRRGYLAQVPIVEHWRNHVFRPGGCSDQPQAPGTAANALPTIPSPPQKKKRQPLRKVAREIKRLFKQEKG